MAPVQDADGLFAAWLAQRDGARDVRRRREGLFTLDGPGYAAAHIALQIGDEERTPDRFAESFGGHGVRRSFRARRARPVQIVPVAQARRAQQRVKRRLVVAYSGPIGFLDPVPRSG